jgi:class 3 adenylate cyclase
MARLRALFSDLIDPTIAVHNGRVVKRIGDGRIVEFRSVVDMERIARRRRRYPNWRGEWWVEAETLEEAQALLAAGRGHRHAVGELVHVELDALLQAEDE